MRPWAILVVQHLEKQTGKFGRVREIDRALGLNQAIPMAEFVKYLGKSKQLPLGLYEIFPEFFQIKEETTKEKQGEGSGILLNPEHPPIVGEELPDWDGEKARGGATRRVREEPEAAPPAAPAAPVAVFQKSPISCYLPYLRARGPLLILHPFFF